MKIQKAIASDAKSHSKRKTPRTHTTAVSGALEMPSDLRT